MPIVQDSSLETAREQLENAREEIIEGARRLHASPELSVEDGHLMALAVLEFFAAQKAFEQRIAHETLEHLLTSDAERAELHQKIAYLEEQANPDAFLR